MMIASPIHWLRNTFCLPDAAKRHGIRSPPQAASGRNGTIGSISRIARKAPSKPRNERKLFLVSFDYVPSWRPTRGKPGAFLAILRSKCPSAEVRRRIGSYSSSKVYG